MIYRFMSLLLLLSLALSISACSSFGGTGRKIDYRNTTTLPSLEVPPDLAGIPDQKAPGAGARTYSDFSSEQKTPIPGASPVLPQYSAVRLARDGHVRYVVVQSEPAVVWDKVRDFLGTTGLSIEKENARAGLIETHWAENRALVGASEDGILSRWMKSNFATARRDKYHVRLERGAEPGTTEVYIAHRGMEELELDRTGAARTGWKPRPSDRELEIEMLQRLVVHLGSQEPVTQTATAPVSNTPAPAPSARLMRNGNGAPLLALEDSLERAWRRVGLSLDRIGFTVEDRDRSKGVYYVRYIDPETAEKEKGFFTRLFTKDEPAPPNQFRVQVKPSENGSSVEVLDKEGAPETSRTGERILSLLYEQLK